MYYILRPFALPFNAEQTDNSQEWFQGWAKTLVESSRRTPLVAGVFQNQPVSEVRLYIYMHIYLSIYI